MKYFTKEWYQMGISSPLTKEDKKAEFFSEEYFQNLYEGELQEFLSFEEKCASCTFDHIFSIVNFCSCCNFEDKSEEEIYAIKQDAIRKREEARKAFKPKKFDKEESIKKFEERFRRIIQSSKEGIPQNILDEIADIRVFGLNRASKKVIEDLTVYYENNKKLSEKTFNEYQNYLEKASEKIDKHIIEKMNFHDCKVAEVIKNENDITIILDNSSGFTDIKSVSFKNFSILQQETPLENYWWIYDELYRVGNKYELHVLLLKEVKQLSYFTIQFEQVAFTE